MSGVYRHKPMSSIIAPSTGHTADGPSVTPPEGTTPPENQLPEKYQGKSPEQIAEMHMNSEKRLGQLQNEVGQLRGLVQDLAQVQRPSAPATQEPVEVTVSGDELIANPAEAIRKVVQPLVQSQKDSDAGDATDKALYAAEQNALLSDFGDPQTIAGSQEFQQFVERTPSRQAEFQKACDPSAGIEQIRAARRLLEDFTDFSASLPASEAEKTQTAVQQAAAVANEGAGPAGAIQTKALVYEADVVAMINSEPEKYRSPSYQKELHEAIRDGRFVKMGG